MDDGVEFEASPGDVTCLPSGHDAWVMGNEPVVVVDWHGVTQYAKGQKKSTRKATTKSAKK